MHHIKISIGGARERQTKAISTVVINRTRGEREEGVILGEELGCVPLLVDFWHMPAAIVGVRCWRGRVGRHGPTAGKQFTGRIISRSLSSGLSAGILRGKLAHPSE
jgi:hypothetical protein